MRRSALPGDARAQGVLLGAQDGNDAVGAPRGCAGSVGGAHGATCTRDDILRRRTTMGMHMLRGEGQNGGGRDRRGRRGGGREQEDKEEETEQETAAARSENGPGVRAEGALTNKP